LKKAGDKALSDPTGPPPKTETKEGRLDRKVAAERTYF